MNKEKISNLVYRLSELGYEGGLYFYKKNECSCCYGLKSGQYEINGNIPGNWGVSGTGGFYYKISYHSDDKKLNDKFRKDANREAVKIFGKDKVQTAKNTSRAIIINS